jgi:organic hydroperoxide reductase OsmC/OhrA
MSLYFATVAWQRQQDTFTDNRYHRKHQWHFDGGVQVPASSSPNVVRVPFSDPAAVDPEEAYVAALSSCHMLWFLSIAAEEGYRVDSYTDAAQGLLAKNQAGQEVMTRVTLKPAIGFSGDKLPSDAVLAHLHHRAHQSCYLANSVKTEIEVEGSWHVTASGTQS